MPAHSKTKVELLLAGIQEVRLHGVQNFSVRRIAASCGVSCSAPYKHFKNKNDYILAILHYINQQWHEVEHEILSQVPTTPGNGWWPSAWPTSVSCRRIPTTVPS